MKEILGSISLLDFLKIKSIFKVKTTFTKYVDDKLEKDMKDIEKEKGINSEENKEGETVQESGN